jgi:hypothetical protein
MKKAVYSILALGLITSASSAMATAQATYKCGAYEVDLFGPDVTDVYQTVNGQPVNVMHIQSSDLSPLSGDGNNAILVVGDTKIPCKLVSSGN